MSETHGQDLKPGGVRPTFSAGLLFFPYGAVYLTQLVLDLVVALRKNFYKMKNG
jgi:hypothetical protein